MTKEEIAWLAEEAGLEPAYPVDHPMAKFIIAVTKRAAEKEREACAKAVSDLYSAGPENGCCPTFWDDALEAAEERIKSRSK